MKYAITCKSFRLTKLENNMVKEFVQKISKLLVTFGKEALYVNVVLRRHKKNSLDHLVKRFIKEQEISHFINHRSIDSPIYFDGTVFIPLPRKTLTSYMLGKSVKEALSTVFENLKEEIAKYKGKHFKGHSGYFDRSTIRRKE